MEQRIEHSSCGIIENNNYFIVVHQTKSNTWAFPKGHIEREEKPLETAYREIFEETGLRDLTFIAKVGEYIRSTKKASFNY